MERLAKNENLDAANSIRFERVAETTSKELLQHTADLGMIVKLLHLETESIRGVKEALNLEIRKTIQEEISAQASSFSNELFVTFSSRAGKFLDGQFFSVKMINENLKNTMQSWSNLSLKSLSLVGIIAVLIGGLSFFASYYFMPSQRLTQDEMNLMYYGQSYVSNRKMIHPEIQKLITEGANQLRQTIVHETK